MKNITKYLGSLTFVFVTLAAFALVNVEKAQAGNFFSDVLCVVDHARCDDDDSPAPAAAATTPDITNATCYANTTSLVENGSASWIATASGGNGTFTYSWSGTDALFGSGSTISKQYYYSGVKSAQVTVTSGTKTLTVTCGNTINVTSQNNNNNNNNNSNSSITGYCYPNTTSVSTNNSVTWTASVVGGNGSYNYSWSGVDGLYGSASSIYKTYYYSGIKTASVYVTSGSQSATIYCTNTVNVIDNNNYNNNNNNYNTLTVSCRPNTTTANTNDSVYWSAYATGGNGNYTYDWSGVDGLYGSASSIYKTYYYSGYKTGSVTVYSNGQSVTRSCDGSVTINDNNYNYNNNNYNNNYSYTQPLNVTCNASAISGSQGNSITWSAQVTGGTGYNTYSWSGTDSLSGYAQSLSKTYWMGGIKTASVTVTSGTQSVTRVCSNTVSITVTPITVPTTTGGDYPPTTTYVAPKTYPQLEVACSANTATANVNDTVVWIAAAKGGSGTYTYKWEGSEGITGTTNYVAKNYYDNGNKIAVLTVKSAGQSLTRVCGNVGVGNVVAPNSNLSASAVFGSATPWIMIVLFLLTIIIIAFVLYFLSLKKEATAKTTK